MKDIKKGIDLNIFVRYMGANTRIKRDDTKKIEELNQHMEMF